jgi:hypothetical protein
VIVAHVWTRRLQRTEPTALQLPALGDHRGDRESVGLDDPGCQPTFGFPTSPGGDFLMALDIRIAHEARSHLRELQHLSEHAGEEPDIAPCWSSQ